MKKFVLLASFALIITACGGGKTEAMEQQATEAEATANELLDQMDAAAGTAADTSAVEAEGAVEVTQ